MLNRNCLNLNFVIKFILNMFLKYFTYFEQIFLEMYCCLINMLFQNERLRQRTRKIVYVCIYLSSFSKHQTKDLSNEPEHIF